MAKPRRIRQQAHPEPHPQGMWSARLDLIAERLVALERQVEAVAFEMTRLARERHAGLEARIVRLEQAVTELAAGRSPDPVDRAYWADRVRRAEFRRAELPATEGKP